ncbi:MAG: N-acetylglucosamine-6-phosphate deacetylase [Bacteroidetes bacterium]|nr:N-acetylglucosamine-6-phosphate deacetylase [Bacteroidota bacterium]MBS1632827.1 N-acetylglucosamine-6-phosphate deacetylase [Bacteroidota bacterium]
MHSTIELKCIDCISNAGVSVKPDNIATATHRFLSAQKHLYCGPGLIELQINGVNGIDFNTEKLNTEDLVNSCQYLLSKGITRFFPTVITNSTANLEKILGSINRACIENEKVKECVAGIHLEGPFISPHDGARGAHEKKYVCKPDWELFCRLQEVSGNKIRIITLAPEWEGAIDFIRQCVRSGIVVSIGHSLANEEQIKNAVEAGATMSTHLGNGVPVMLSRHPNIIWDQLSNDKLYTTFIADGIHLPDSFLKTLIRVKGDHAVIVSDATYLAGMEPGEYTTHIGGQVVLDSTGRLSLKSNPALLAGASKDLLQNIEVLIQKKISSLSQAWQMASVQAYHCMQSSCGANPLTDWNGDRVLFTIDAQGNINIQLVLKSNKIVFENKTTEYE